MRRAACWSPTRRWSTGGITDGAYYQLAGRPQPREPRPIQGVRSSARLRLAAHRRTARRSFAAATASSSIPPRDARSTAPRTSIPYVSRGNYQQSLGQPAPLQTTDVLFPSFEAPGVATPAANTFLAVSQSPEPQESLRPAMVARRAARDLASARSLELNYIGNKGTNLLMRRNIAQAFPYDPAQPEPSRSAKPYPELRRLHRQRLGRTLELQRASTPSSSIAAARRC